MTIQIEIPVEWMWWAVAVSSGSGVLLGLLSFLWPRGSIGLYQWIMSCINWRVIPIDEGREAKTTRRLGFYLLILAGASLTLSYFFYFKTVIPR